MILQLLFAPAMEAQAHAVGWPVGQEPGHIDPALMAGYLDFLSEDLMAGSRDPLDPGTLAAVAAAQGQDRQKKRPNRDASSLDVAAANEAASNDEDLSDDEEEDHKKGKKGKGSAAAQNKANREKARREKINDRCELGHGVEAGQKVPRLCWCGRVVEQCLSTQVYRTC